MESLKVPMAKPDFGHEEEQAILDVVKSGWLGQGEKTRCFEEKLSDYISSNAVVVNNGSSAIMCSLLAHDIKPGDEVVVPNFTFMSTASVPKILGAKIIPVDINKHTLNLDLDELEKILKSGQIKFVIFVDVAGLSNDLDRLKNLSKKYNFTLIEDAAEAFGSEYKNKRLGSFDVTTVFSFHIAKQITTIEGGCIATKDKELAKKISAIKDIGRTSKGYTHKHIGSNFRITDIQSAIGLEQIKKIDKFIQRRQKIAQMYKQEIKEITFQDIPPYSTLHTYMLFFAIAPDEKTRNQYVNKLRENGIDARISWLPINKQPCFPELNNLKFTNSETIYQSSFTLPIYNTLTDNEVIKTIDICNKISA